MFGLSKVPCEIFLKLPIFMDCPFTRGEFCQCHNHAKIKHGTLVKLLCCERALSPFWKPRLWVWGSGLNHDKLF